MNDAWTFETMSVRKSCPDEENPLLLVEISVPRIVGPGRPRAAKRINGYYSEVVKSQLRYASGKLLPKARKAALAAAQEGTPFPPWTLSVAWRPVWTGQRTFSLTWDAIETRGGLPQSVRYVDNWDAETGFPLVCAMTGRRRRSAILQCRRQAEALYGGQAANAVKKHFRAENCFFEEGGIGVVYPMHTLASREAGFPVLHVKGVFSL